MFDIIFFAIVAFIIFNKLFKALGDTQYDNDKNAPDNISSFFSNFTKNMEENSKTTKNIDIASGLEASLSEEERNILDQIRRYDSSFIVDNFLANASKAFKMIVESFAAGDKDSLEQLLSDQILQKFYDEIDQRSDSEQIKEIEVVSVQDLVIEKIEKIDLQVHISLAITSEQIEIVRDKVSNELISKSKIKVVKDHWTFAKQINSSSKAWKLLSV